MNNLKSLQLSKGLSQQALAGKLGSSQQTIYKYEHHITEPDFHMLKVMADFLMFPLIISSDILLMPIKSRKCGKQI